MDFKNVSKKRDLWQKISINLRNCYDINMSGNFLFVKLLLFNIKIFCNLILIKLKKCLSGIQVWNDNFFPKKSR